MTAYHEEFEADEDERAGEFDPIDGEETCDAEYARLLGRCPDCGGSLSPDARLNTLTCECGYRWEAE